MKPVVFSKSSVAAIVAMLTGFYARAYDFEADGIYYDITDEAGLTCEVANIEEGYSHASDSYSGVVTVPSTVVHEGNTYSVTRVGKYAFYKCGELTTINLPETIESIGYWAF